LIQLKNVSVELDKPILHDVSLTIPGGCLYGLIGPGAAGKSVLLKAIAGLCRFVGEVWFDHQEVGSLSEPELSELRASIGMLFQNNALFDFMTVAENVAFPLRQLFDLDEAQIQHRVTERLHAVGLPGFEARMPTGLSGGQKKRVGVARATVTAPPTVLYDEPAAGLDPVSSQKLLELLRQEQRARSSTVIMVSSDLDRLLSVCDRVGMLVAGELVFDGTPETARCSMDPYVRQFIRGETEGPLQ
jgi:phospholipid/cholesterol/gamma-HCH transport system ATP-binding protein